MQQHAEVDLKRDNRVFLACAVLAAIGIAFRLTELANLWGAA